MNAPPGRVATPGNTRSQVDDLQYGLATQPPASQSRNATTRPPTASAATQTVRAMAPPAKPPSPRACVICADEDSSESPLIKACRLCPAEYCSDCLEDMFRVSLRVQNRFPPQCCTFIQLYTVLENLSKNEADDYRLRFEEWLTLDKIYCPVPSCSAYIPAKQLPAPQEPIEDPAPLQNTILRLLNRMEESPNARFFKGDINVQALSGYCDIVSNHIDLKMMRAKLYRLQYSSTTQLTADISLLVANARLYNGSDHPVTITAEKLREEYLKAFSEMLDDLLKQKPGTRQVQTIFACPSCHVALCAMCKQVEHQHKPCDFSKGDEEVAMLKAFGYKQCPRCHHAVRRMFGCSHMECHCGAHWCWWCGKSMDECMGDCGGPQDEDDEEDEDEEGEGGEEDGADDDDGDCAMADTTAPSDAAPIADGSNATNPDFDGAASTTIFSQPINLDAGGASRWAGTGLDFGPEPGEGESVQVWSCNHEWSIFAKPDDNSNYGNLDLMECNKCFKSIKPQARFENSALECLRCRLIVCASCSTWYDDRAVG